MAGDDSASIQIRVATAADVPAMHRIRLAVRENRLASGLGPADYTPFLEVTGRGWTASIGDRIVGFAIADREHANVWALFVDPDHERRGAGRRLHDVMVDWLFASGADPIWLTTAPGSRAERFYRAAGWIAAGSEPNGEIRFELSERRWPLRSARST
jgi:GNAT superfamily N-acetyltransferase